MRIGTYTDQEYDAESGLYNYNARLYDPAVGIFISPDSIVPDLYDPQILNRYAYVRNNPLIYVDPSGHSIDTADHDPISDLKDSIDSATSGDDSDQDDENNDNFEIAKIDSPEYEEALRRIENSEAAFHGAINWAWKSYDWTCFGAPSQNCSKEITQIPRAKA